MAPGEHVRAAREDLGWSQQRLADEIGLTRAAVSRIESGSRAGDLDSWRRLVVALRLDPAVVLPPDARPGDAA